VSNNGCSGGSFHAGSSAPYPCPGDNDIQCCIQDTSPPPPRGGDSVGAQVLAKAETAAGTPYAWGGGSCSGPSHDEPPYEYGDIGYDCSGLVCWALCQVTGRDLFTEGLRNTHTMYCASESDLKYK
jgi:NlpC/P60 family